MEVMTPSEEMANAVYNCALCFRCKEECIGGFDVPQVMLATRAEAVDDGLHPISVRRRVESLRQERADRNRALDAMRLRIESDVGNLSEKALVVVFAGHSVLDYTPEALLGAAKVLREAGVDFALPNGSSSSGFEFYEMGFLDDAKKGAMLAIDAINKALDSCKGDRTVVVLDPSDGWLLRDLHRKLGLECSFEVVDFSSYTHDLAKEGRIKFGQRDLEITFHDPCHLGRLYRVFAQPRKLLSMIPGVVLREMHWNQSQSHCCGGHLRSANPDVANRVAKQRVEQIKETGANIVVTACPTCCKSLDEAKVNLIDDLKVYHIAEFLAESID